MRLLSLTAAGDIVSLLSPTDEKFQRMRNCFPTNPLELFIRWRGMLCDLAQAALPVARGMKCLTLFIYCLSVPIREIRG